MLLAKSIKIFLILFSVMAYIAICNCSRVEPENTELKTYPKDFTPYIKNFEKLFKVKTSSQIQFFKLSEGEPGRCLADIKQIHINEEMWEDFEEITREALIIHELGHCELKLLHTSDGTPHIMSEFIGFNVSAYKNKLQEEISFMLSPSHPNFND